MKGKYIFAVIGFIVTIGVHRINADNKAKPNCLFPSLNGKELAAVGDSRAQLFVHDIYEGGFIGSNGPLRSKADAITNAINNHREFKLIIKEGQVQLIDRAFSGSKAEEWIGILNGCSALGGHFALPDKVWISIGGNDVLSFFKKREEFRTKWKPKSSELDALSVQSKSIIGNRFDTQRKGEITKSLQSGLKTLEEVRAKWENDAKNTGRVINENQSKGNILGSYAFWDWDISSRVDVITQNAITINERILTDNPKAKVLMNTVAPVALPSPQYMLDLLISNPGKFNEYLTIALNYPAVYNMFIKLWVRYYVRLYPTLASRYGGRFIFLDTAEYFSRNILTAWATLYLSDAVHYNTEGNKVFGKFMAIEMVKAGWYEPGPGYIGSKLVMKFYDDIEVSFHHFTLTAKGIVSGINADTLTNRSMSFSAEKGFKKDFSEINAVSYMKYDAQDAFLLNGLILSKYVSLGETSSNLGFPTSDPFLIHFDTIDRVNFECGYIDHNRLDLLNPNNTAVHITSNTCGQ